MPQCFRFNYGGHSFSCKLTSEQCTAPSSNGQRCRNRVIVGLPFCHAHNKKYLSLEVKVSSIPNAGKGVFARSPDGHGELVFERGDFIVGYLGERLGRQQIDARYPGNLTAPYGIQVGDTEEFIDAACRRGLGPVINHAPKRTANCEYRHEVVNGENVVSIRATKRIYDGTELKVYYGRVYGFEDSHKTVSCR